MNLLLTRPEFQAKAFERKLQQLGHSVLLAPLLEISLEQPVFDIGSIQAIIVTSQNTIRAFVSHPNYQKILKVPLVVVGSSTGEEARKAGFRILFEGKLGATELADSIKAFINPHEGPLLYASGDVVAVDLEQVLRSFGFDIHRSILYRTNTIKHLPGPVLYSIQNQTLDAVILMSPQTSKAWSNLIIAAGLKDKIQSVAHLCFSNAVAAHIRELKKVRIEIPLKPNMEEFLCLISRISPQCET